MKAPTKKQFAAAARELSAALQDHLLEKLEEDAYELSSNLIGNDVPLGDDREAVYDRLHLETRIALGRRLLKGAGVRS